MVVVVVVRARRTSLVIGYRADFQARNHLTYNNKLNGYAPLPPRVIITPRARARRCVTRTQILTYHQRNVAARDLYTYNHYYIMESNE